jgi:tetratricopeptide (TPR) repeat protein
MKPSQAHTLLQQADAYQRAGRSAEAINVCKRVLSNLPRDPGANYLLANLYAQQGETEKAVRFFKSTVEIRPEFTDARYNLAYALNLTGMHEEAVAQYEAVLGASPGHLNALVNYANTLTLIGRHADALSSYDRVIALVSNSAVMFANRGLVLNELKCFERALADCDRAILLDPQYAAAHFNRGAALYGLKRLTEGLESYDKAIQLQPEYAEAWLNRGVTLHDLRRFEEALASYAKAIALSPGNAESYVNRGTTLHELRRFDEERESYDRALSIRSDQARVIFARGSLALLEGDFVSGWPQYESRKATKDYPVKRVFDRPLWTGGTDIGGKKILVYSEQGLGDTIQFSRYVKSLQQMGAHVLFAPQRSLIGLMKSLGGDIVFADVADPNLSFELHCPLMSLPLAFRTGEATVPERRPYLFANPARAQQWAGRIGGRGFKVGICWQGSTTKIDVGRSFNVREFSAISAIKGVRLISLHKGEGEAQLIGLPEGMKVETLGEDFDAGPDGFLDGAAVIAGLDLVITSDTAVAHLAGALGKEAWVVLQQVPDWRWQLDRSDSPWYPTLRLFRQQQRDDWKSVFAEIQAALAERVRISSEGNR